MLGSVVSVEERCAVNWHLCYHLIFILLSEGMNACCVWSMHNTLGEKNL